MATLSSAQKSGRNSERNRLVNNPVKKGIKTHITGSVAAIKTGDQTKATEEVKKAIVALDRGVTRGALHPNNAARRKSRLMSKLNAAFHAKEEVAPAAEKKKKA